MYVLRCIDLYIKSGGFTYDIGEAKRFRTYEEAKAACVPGWEIVKVKEGQ